MARRLRLDEKQLPIRGVIFDLFRTLTGIESEWPDLPVTSDVLGINRRVWDDILVTRSRKRLTGAQRDPFEIVRTLAHEVDPTIPESRIREAVRIRSQWFRHALRSIPQENIDAIKHLRAADLRLGLISNADAMEVAAWEESPLVGLFDVEIFSCEVGFVKPDPAIFRRCLDALKLTPCECLFVGDGGSNELIGAKEVGLSTVFVSGVMAEHWPDRVPERIKISDFHIALMPQILGLLGLSGDCRERHY
jgi:putative hydrolase of the HAD superfamily